jgi:glutathione S-transferase
VLTLYYRSTCPYSLRVRIVLAEKLVPFRRRVVNGDERPAELEDLSKGRVPALVDGSFAIADSLVIAEYVEESFPKPALLPFDARGRAVVRMAMRRIDADVMDPLESFEERKHTPKGDRYALDDRVVEQLLASVEPMIGYNGLLCGMEFSLADVWLFAAVEWARVRGYTPGSKLPNFAQWLARFGERTSVRTERLDR